MSSRKSEWEPERRKLSVYRTGASASPARARFEDRELLRQLQEVAKLPDEDKAVVKRFLDAFVTKKQIQDLAAR